MTRKEHLMFCKICKNQKFDPKQGIICGLTGKKADFDLSCASFDPEENQAIVQPTINGIDPDMEMMKANNGIRFANYMLDTLFIYGFSMILGIFLGIIFGLFSPYADLQSETGFNLLFYLLGIIAVVMYYTFLEATTGRTLGKFITKTKVVNYKGETPSFGVILKRTLCRLIPFEAFSFLGSDETGWHDTLSKTLVVDVKRYNMKKQEIFANNNIE
ncbi:RDD family protein [Saccharicrinis sp. FJH62]|uniref:RDD family protein n=1 Tax=Saccharicrinis sp. FJH62 TaxID=3344657 RepID=UPI0035D466AB